MWGFFGSLGLAVVAYAFKPDTRYVWTKSCLRWIETLVQRAELIVKRSIQTWALEEARRRLEAEGILPDPDAENAPAADGDVK